MNVSWGILTCSSSLGKQVSRQGMSIPMLPEVANVRNYWRGHLMGFISNDRELDGTIGLYGYRLSASGSLRRPATAW
jgi:hypothetical protein